MLPTSYQQRYQSFLETLQKLQNQLNQDFDGTQLQSMYSQLQQQFQQEIMSLTGEELSGEQLSRWQSWQTEIHRLMRLLQNDLIFWQTSKNPNTSEKRLATIRDRVDSLIQFASAFTSQQQ